jgi:hypothetical protein
MRKVLALLSALLLCLPAARGDAFFTPSFLIPGSTSAAPIALVASTSAGSTNGGNSVTTGAINTAGANLIVVSVSGAPSTLSDSKGNTWTALTTYGGVITLYYCVNPTVGTGHTFTEGGATTFAAISVMAFSGVSPSSPLDQQNGNGTVTTSIQPGSVSPSQNNELIVTGLLMGPGTASIDSGFNTPIQTAFNGGNAYGTAMSYLVQTTAGAVNPTWSISPATSTTMYTAIATFK